MSYSFQALPPAARSCTFARSRVLELVRQPRAAGTGSASHAAAAAERGCAAEREEASADFSLVAAEPVRLAVEVSAQCRLLIVVVAEVHPGTVVVAVAALELLVVSALCLDFHCYCPAPPSAASPAAATVERSSAGQPWSVSQSQQPALLAAGLALGTSSAASLRDSAGPAAGLLRSAGCLRQTLLFAAAVAAGLFAGQGGGSPGRRGQDQKECAMLDSPWLGQMSP